MSAPRGQNLVLLSLTMLFLALMVTMTIGLGLRIRQRHELQNLSDAAAYSNAIMTARTFNNMAVINRLEVSYWVAMAADESLISWTSYARAMADGSHNAAQDILNSNCRLTVNERARLTGFRNDVRDYVQRDIEGSAGPLWRQLDQAAGAEAESIQGKISDLRGELMAGRLPPPVKPLQDRLFEDLSSQVLTNAILSAAMQGDVSVLDGGLNSASRVSRREVDCDFLPGGSEEERSGLCSRHTWSEAMLSAAMGSRGDPFLTSRTAVPSRVGGRLERYASDHGVALGLASGKQGSAYWARTRHGGMSSEYAWGDDHGLVQVSVGNCRGTAEIKAHVFSTDQVDRSDEHQWEPQLRADGPAEDKQPDVHHTMGICVECPSVWVRTPGFKPHEAGGAEEDAWGQPKLMVALERDLLRDPGKGRKPFPWELHFQFPFSATGAASEWDGRGLSLHTRGSNRLSIRRMTALATGMAYYHRSEHWDEPANLLNPFWRATLVPMDVDSPNVNRSDDVRTVLSAPGLTWQREAYDQLVGANYQGLH